MRLEHLRLLGFSFRSFAERNLGACCKTLPAEKTCSTQVLEMYTALHFPLFLTQCLRSFSASCSIISKSPKPAWQVLLLARCWMPSWWIRPEIEIIAKMRRVKRFYCANHLHRLQSSLAQPSFKIQLSGMWRLQILRMFLPTWSVPFAGRLLWSHVAEIQR